MSSKFLDVRAHIYCNLGPVISGNLEENTIVGAGLVNVTGTVVLDGVYKIKRGQPVRLAYYKSDRVTRLGRALRVISSYANPTTRTTELSVGCLLTYHKNNEPAPEVVTSENDTDTPDLTELQKRLMLKPIYARYVASLICSKLGIQHKSIPLTNQFYKETFKLEGPYLNVLSDLLISEGYVGYIDSNEQLAFVDLNDSGGSGPVIDETKIISVEPINSGDPAADRVYSIINYTAIKLDDAVTQDTGETEEEIDDRNGNPTGPPVSSYYLRASDYGGTVSKTFEHKDQFGVTETETLSYVDYSEQLTTYESVETDRLGNRALKPVRIEAVESDFFGQRRTVVTKSYSGYDDETSTVLEERIVTESGVVIVEACGLPSFSFPPLPQQLVALSPGTVITERTETYTVSVAPTPWAPGSSVTRTRAYKPFVQTADGAAYIQKLVEARSVKAGRFTTMSLADAKTIISRASTLTAENIVVSYNEQLPTFEPPPEIGDEDEAANRADPANGATWNVYEEPEIIYARETEGGINLELTPPYVSDDKVFSNGSGYYYTQRSDAPEKALNFARTQNRLRYGYRNGQAVVYPIEFAPIKPFKPMYLSFGGVTGQFRSDRTSIAFDSSGILVSTDAIFWGGVGR